MIRQRVLFVDDEQAILDGLEDRLIGDARRWELLFVSGGQAALDLMAKQPVDIVISDMRMPGMDGAELLGRVMERYPGTARLVLTGHAEREAIFRALPVSHQLISKPCDTKALRSAIERTLELQRMVSSDAVRELVGGFASLPSAPTLYLRLTAAAANPKSNLTDLSLILGSDPAMGAKILQLANSAYFGLRQTVVSISQAVSCLGLELIKGLALVGDMFTSGEDALLPGYSFERAQRHSLLVAQVARKLVDDKPRSEEAFTAALVHDIGGLILALKSPEAYGRVLAATAAGGRPIQEIEAEQLGTTHAEIGAYLLGVWGLPFSIVEAVAHHHQPARVLSGDRSVLAAVHAADALVEAELNARQPTLDVSFLKDAGFEARLEEWQRIAHDEVARVDQSGVARPPGG